MSRNTFRLADLTGDHVRIRWVPETDDLHMNVVHLRPGEEIGEHVNAALDVIVTCLQGDGTISVDATGTSLQPGSIVLIPRGANRHIVAGDSGMVYTTVHRKRGGILPTVSAR